MRLLSWRLFGGGRAETADDYAGVLIPLEEAHLYSHSARSGRTEYEELSGDDGGDGGDGVGAQQQQQRRRGAGGGENCGGSGGNGKRDEHEGTGMLQMCAAEYSIEGLRREVRRGEKGRQWSAYESESSLS